MQARGFGWFGWFVVGTALSCSSGAASGSAAPDAGNGGSPSASGGSAGAITNTGGRTNTGGSPSGGRGGQGGQGGGTSVTPSRRVVGYLPNWNGSYTDWIAQLSFTSLTHINLAFANAGAGDNVIDLAPSGDLDAFVAAAHSHGVKVLPSLGGGSDSGNLCDHFVAGNVDAFVASIDAFVDAHGFDGVDVDAESPGRMGDAYGTFIDKLKQKLAPKNKLLTAAVAQWIQGDMPDSALHQFDFVNVMSYDNCGSWTNACPHSSYEQAVADLAYYTTEKQVPKAQTVLGVPFYGYCWGACDSAYHLYSDIVSRYADAWQFDWLDRDGAQWSYNGESTMAAKAALARDYGGIMIWELSGDVSGAHSLLGVVVRNL